jgi:hypothetical protein
MLLPGLVARSLAAVDPRLGAALAVLQWPGGDPALDPIALGRADVVLAYGRSETLSHLAAHRPRHLLRFGPRVSAGLIASEAARTETARQAALQVALFDQQGCLSPQLLLVEETDRAATARFTDDLVRELARLAVTLPRAPLTVDEATLVRRFLERQRWLEQEGADVHVEADPAGRFAVVSDRTAALPASPLHRHVIIVPVASVDAAAMRLTPLDGQLEAIGYAGPERRLGEAAALAASCGAHRLCPLERMQAPPFAWRQSGHGRLRSFLAAADDDPENVRQDRPLTTGA